MSKEHVKAFYERLAKDKAFKARIEAVESKQECSQIVRKAGFDFTQEEFEEFTAQLLNSDANNSEELGDIELEAAIGGSAFFQDPKNTSVPMYGLPPDLIDFSKTD